MLNSLADFLWGPQLLCLLILVSLWLLFYTRLQAFKLIYPALKTLAYSQRTNPNNSLSPLRSLCNSLATTIGLGNIAGVAVAIQQGGPGVIFWFWVSGILGMNTKFFEVYLAVKYRQVNKGGKLRSGPMHLLERLPRGFFLAKTWAAIAVVGTLPLFNGQQLGYFWQQHYQVPPYVCALIIGLGTAYILCGGMGRLSNWTIAMVPSMGIFYICACLGIILAYSQELPSLLKHIFASAFTGEAIWGSAQGLAWQQIMGIGLRRGAFSNEAGLGTAGIAHGSTTNPAKIAGGVAMLGPGLDTIVICSLSGFCLLLVPIDLHSGVSGIGLSREVFVSYYPSYGGSFLALALTLFSFSTIVGAANYSKQCWDYLWKNSKISHTLVFSCSMAISPLLSIESILALIDSAYALMAYPNLLLLLYYCWLSQKEGESFSKFSIKNRVSLI